jgi:hypothetical protein
MATQTFDPHARSERAPTAAVLSHAPGRALTTIALAMLIAELWLTTRYYQGIVRDARFYMVQALRELDPAHFAGDLYFRFGSQDQFTVFTKLYAPLVAYLGVGAAAVACTLGGQLLWVCGLVYCASRVIRGPRYALLAAAGAIILPSLSPLFGYGEEFVTPRLFAEGLSLLALGFLLRRHTWRAFAVLAVAAVLHPLTSLPGLAFALLYLAAGRRLWWAAIAAGAALTAGLAFLGVPPFANLRATFDPAWFDIVRVRDLQCFVTAWPVVAYFRVLDTVALSALALVVAKPREYRFLWVGVAVGLGGLACTLIGADLAHNVLITQLQPWRSMWLLTVIAHVYAVPILLRLRRRDEHADLAALMFATALAAEIASQFSGAIVFAAAPMMTATAALAFWQSRTGRQAPAPVRGFGLFAIAVVGGATIAFTLAPALLMRSLPQEYGRWLYSAASVTASAGIMTAWLRELDRPRRRAVRVLACLTAMLLAAAAANWDDRTPWTKFVEAPAAAPESLATLLPAGASVYWEGGLELLWFKLQRPSYFSCDQGTGVVFFRETAIEFHHRAESLWPLRAVDFGRSILCPPFDKSANPERTRADLQFACSREPRLDYLVLTRPVSGVGATIWRAPARFADIAVSEGTPIATDTDTFYVYSCASLSRLPAEMPLWHFRGVAAQGLMPLPSG